MLQEAAPLLLPLALAPAALLLRLLDPRLQILIKLNNLKKSQILVNFTHFNKKNLFFNAPGDAKQELPQNMPCVRHQHVTFGPAH